MNVSYPSAPGTRNPEQWPKHILQRGSDVGFPCRGTVKTKRRRNLRHAPGGNQSPGQRRPDASTAPAVAEESDVAMSFTAERDVLYGV